MWLIAQLIPLCCWIGAASAHQYSPGLCRPHITKHVFNKTVSLHELVQDGDYTVLYTSGLKQLKDVSCARIGYTHGNTDDTFKYYTYLQTDEGKELLVYDIHQADPGKFTMLLEDNELSLQFIMYHKQDILLIYWCKTKGDDNYYNNIWILAAKTPEANSKLTKKAILEMLYHDDYKGLIDSDIEEAREEQTKYVELSTCDQSDF